MAHLMIWILLNLARHGKCYVNLLLDSRFVMMIITTSKPKTRKANVHHPIPYNKRPKLSNFDVIGEGSASSLFSWPIDAIEIPYN